MTVITVCPHCGARYRNVPQQHVGKSLRCRKCHTLFRLEPALATPSPQATQILDKTPVQEKTQRLPTRPTGGETGIHDGGPEAEDWAVGEVILDLYEVRELLGEGQFGKVHRVHHRGWNLDLAVKSPKPEALAMGADYVEQEAETWVNLGLHPHIVSCYYVRRIGGTPRVFAEFVGGGDLKGWIKAQRLYEGGVDPALARILDMAIQFAWGLHYAHEQGLIHQDVKPANVMITPDGLLKITDFGLAKAGALAQVGGDGEGGKTIVVAGYGMTPAYASPEQVKAMPLTRRTDLWGWALSVLEMFTGCRTWSSGAAAGQVLTTYLAGGTPRTGLPRMPKALSNLLLRCFQEDPDQRPHDLREVANVLTDIYQGLVGQPYPRLEPAASRDTADSLNNRAVSLFDLGRLNEAESLWKRALMADPEHLESTYNLALYEWRKKGLQESEILRRMRALRQAHGQSSRYLHWLGKIHLFCGQYTQAIQQLREALNTHQGLPADLCKDLGLALCAAGRDSQDARLWSKALECFSQVGSEQADPATVAGHSLSLERLGRMAEAMARYHNHASRLGHMPAQAETACATYLPGYEVVRELACPGALEVVVVNEEPLCLATYRDRRLRLWDPHSGQEVCTLASLRLPVTALAAAPYGRAVSASEDGTLHVWDLSTRQAISSFRAHRDRINALALSPDGQRVLCASADRTLSLWELSTGERCTGFLGQGHIGAISSVAVTPDGRYAVSGSEEKTVRLWDMDTGKTQRIWAGHTLAVSCVAAIPGVAKVVSAGLDGTLRLWDIESGECLQTLNGHIGPVNGLAVAADGQYAISGSSDGTLRYWDLGTGTSLIVGRFAEAVSKVDLDAKGDILLAVHGTGIAVLDPHHFNRYTLPYAVAFPISASEADQRERRYRASLREARQHMDQNDYARALELTQQARSIQGYARDTEALALWTRLYCVYPKTELRGAWRAGRLTGHDGVITALAAWVEPGQLVSGGYDNTLRVWDLETGECQRVLTGHTEAITSVVVTPNGTGVLSGSRDGTARLWSVASGACRVTFSKHRGPVTAVAVTPDSRYALSAEEDGTCCLWTLRDGDFVGRFRGRHRGTHALAIAPDGGYALTGGRDGRLHMWDMVSGKRLKTFVGHKDRVTSVAITPDGRYGLSASGDNTVRRWALKSPRPMGRVLVGHSKRITSIVVSPSGRYALSGSEDQTLHLWELHTGDCLRTFEPHTRVAATAFSVDGRYALAGTTDGSILVWYLDWTLEPKAREDWDEGAYPYLQGFLKVHAPGEGQNRPVWSAEDFDALLRALGFRGYGWLRPEGVRHKLDLMAKRRLVGVQTGQRFSTPRLAGSESLGGLKKVAMIGAAVLLTVFLGARFLTSPEPVPVQDIEDSAGERVTVEKLSRIAVLLAEANDVVVEETGKQGVRTLSAPKDLEALKQQLNLQDEDLRDAWGTEFLYGGFNAGPFQGQFGLRSAGVDRKMFTEDDLVMKGMATWDRITLFKGREMIARPAQASPDVEIPASED